MISAAFLGIAALVAGAVAGAGVAAESVAATEDRVRSTSSMAGSTGLEREQLAAYGGIARVRAHAAATAVIAQANAVIAATRHKVDASTLTEVVSILAAYENLPLDRTVSLTARTTAEIAAVTAAAAAADHAAAKVAAIKAAAAKAAAAKVAAARAVAAKAAKARAAVARALAARASRAASASAANAPAGARTTAGNMAASRYAWGSGQFSCLAQLWQKESGWNYRAYNASSGATGIPQALPGNKMASAGSDWATNASTQIAWGLSYIKSRYGSPCAAWEHSRAMNWY